MNTDRIIIINNDSHTSWLPEEYVFSYYVVNDANFSILAGFDFREDAELFIEALGNQK